MKRRAKLFITDTADAAMMMLQMPFPSQINVQPGIGVVGDFCDTNPRAALNAGPGGLICGPAGVVVGRFAWATQAVSDGDNAPASVSNNGTGLPSGFVHREQQALITTYLAESGMVVPPGFPITLFMSGGFFVINSGTAQALPGQYAYANYANGLITFAAGTQATVGTGQNGGAATITGSIGPVSSTFTGSISGNILTVTGTVSGGVVVGGTLSGGTGIVAGTNIVSQISGTPGGVGTYAVSIPEQTVALALLTEASGLLTVSAVTGTIGLGVQLTGTANNMVPTTVTAFGTGSGGAGTYVVGASQTILVNSTVTGQTNIQTKFIAMSAGLPGELVKMSSWPFN